MSAISDNARRLGLGRLAYSLLYRPVGLVRQSIREGGPFEQRKSAQGHAEMRAAAAELPTLAEPPVGPSAEIAFLTGPKYWHQTLFCFISLQLQTPFRITPVIYADGKMDAETGALIQRVVPWARLVSSEEIEVELDAILPESRFPALRARRREYPHLRKLTDIHVGSNKFTLVADSDMLFFREPLEILQWFACPGWIYMQDIGTAYGYPLDFLSELAGAAVPEPVNVGLYALDGAGIDWERVEYWCFRQIEQHGPQYVQEQALTAMLFAGRDARALPRDSYVVMPEPAEGENPTAILHHYVDVSKHAYFRYGWRRIAAMAKASQPSPGDRIVNWSAFSAR